jgi:hypothetical protein
MKFNYSIVLSSMGLLFISLVSVCIHVSNAPTLEVSYVERRLDEEYWNSAHSLRSYKVGVQD